MMNAIVNNMIITPILEQEVDGETLPMLVNCGSIDQLKACGLQTIGNQMKLRKLFMSLTPAAAASPVNVSSPSFVSDISTTTSTSTSSRKLKRTELKQLTPTQKHIYLMK